MKTLAQIRADETADRLYRGGDIDGCEHDSFVDGFNAGARAVMERVAELENILAQVCFCPMTTMPNERNCKCCIAIANWQAFKGSNDEPG